MRLLTRREYFETAGLVVQNNRNDRLHAFPLRSMRIHGAVVDGLVHVSMEQVFETVPIFDEEEADVEEGEEPAVIMSHYQLPLDEQAAVTKFEAVVDDRIIKGLVKEKQQARQDFEQAVFQGKNAFLAEQTRPDIFRISVGNLPMATFARVTVAYVAPLQTRGVANHELLFVLPTAIAPQYEPLSNSEGILPVGGPLIQSGVQVSLSIIQNRLLRVSSDTHQIAFCAPADGQVDALVRVVDQDPLRRDIVIKMETERTAQKPQVYFEECAVTSSSALMVSFVPDLSLQMTTGSGRNDFSLMEWIFVVDRSGSMDGNKMHQLKATLSHVFNEVLPRDAVFNIISFGSHFEYMFQDGSKPVAEYVFRSLALKYIAGMTANFGGTEILKPLESVLSSKPDRPNPRAIIVLTDGQVSNSKDVIEYVQNNSSSTRVFSIGIGEHASRLLVQGIARAGGGSADFVDGDSSEVIQAAVERQIEMAYVPSMVDVQMKWKFLNQSLTDLVEHPIKQSPYLLPPLVHGKPTRVYFLVEEEKGKIARPQALTIKGKLFGSNQDIEFQVRLDAFVENKESEVIHKMTARELIRDLEEGRSEFHNAKCRSQFSQVSQEIVRVGVKYQISSSQTSFVAIDNEEDLHTTSSPAALNESHAERLEKKYVMKLQNSNRAWDAADQRWVEVDAWVSKGTRDHAKGVNRSAVVQAMVNHRVNEMRESQAKALQEVREREVRKQREEAEEDEVRKRLQPIIEAWKEEHGKNKDLRALLASLHTILWPGAKWKQLTIGDLMNDKKVKVAFHKASRVVHPDKTHHLPAEQRFLAKRIFDALSQAKTEFDEGKKQTI